MTLKICNNSVFKQRERFGGIRGGLRGSESLNQLRNELALS